MTPPPPPHAADHVRNVLFIMCDQLRADALGCCGGIIDTPNIDALAGRGVRFTNAYVQGAVCGSSRMSTYTGRYVASHGVRYNRIPLDVGQRTLGDHLDELVGVRPTLIGKTHMAADTAGIERMGLDRDDPRRIYLAECGFAPDLRHDGLAPGKTGDRVDLPYNDFLRQNGFDEPNPWRTANSVRDANGEFVSGWLLRSSAHPAIVPDELSETAWLTDQAIDWITDKGDDRWCVHLSYIKPHWPYVVSEPYHQLVDPLDLPAPNRSDAELDTDHPVLRAFRRGRLGSTMSTDHVRRTVYPAYLGLVAQIDFHLGRLFAELDRLGRSDDTMIVLTSDHGDYLGDHWMGDKDWFHDEIVNVPLLIADPRPAADSTRGSTNAAVAEAIDLAPTFVEAMGGDLRSTDHWLEGTSLVPRLHGVHAPADAVAVCEEDFGYLEMSEHLPVNTPVAEQRATMLFDGRHKYILCETGPNLLYDLQDDPDELVDRAGDPSLATVVRDLREQLFTWYRRRANETTTAVVHRHEHHTEGSVAKAGVFIGYWDEDDAARDGASHLL